MRRFAPICLLWLALVPAPAIAQAARPAVPHTHEAVKAAGYTAVFHFVAPDNPVYTCPKHPAVTSMLPLIHCPKCQTELELQSHALGVAINDGTGRPLTAGRMHLDVVGPTALSLELPFSGYFQAPVYLAPGSYRLVARYSPVGGGPAARFETAYTTR